MRIRMLRTLKIRTYAGFAVWAMALSLLGGCATGGKVETPVSHENSAEKEPALEKEPSVEKGPSVARLDNGRDGFIITEIPNMDNESRRDFDRAVAMLKKEDYVHAIELLEKVIKQSPGVTAPYIDIAIAYQHIGKPEKAEEHLKTALKIFPEHPVVCNEYGLLYRKTGRFAEARAIYEKVIARFPDYYPAHKNLGILCDLYLNNPACALEQYEIYSKARPEDKQVTLWIADLRTRLGRK